MTDEALKADLERTWAAVRRALEEYRLEDLKKHLEIPEGTPAPTRAQAKELAAFLPDLSKGKFLKLLREGGRLGYYAQTDLDKKGQVTVSVVRFQEAGAGWEPVRAPHTCSSYSTDEKLDAAGILKLIETEDSLRLEPEGSDEAPPAEASGEEGGEPPDTRPEPAIRKELETIWRRIRETFAAGKPEGAADLLLLDAGVALPEPGEAREIAKTALPDLARGRFIKLGWRREKPHLAGYYAEVNTGDAKKTTVALVVFVRKGGAWKFAPGPAPLSVVELPPTGQAALLKLIETDSRLTL